MPPKKDHSEYTREWRKCRAQHGSVPVETLGSAGHANLGFHVDAARVLCPDDLRRRQDCAALVNWNRRQWTVLQRDPSGDGWMHTNSIEGVALRCGRRRRLSDEAVQEVLEDIRRDAGGVALHAIARAVGADGATALGKGRMARLGAR